MKIGINLIQYTDITGVEVFARNLLSGLIKQAPNDEFILFVNSKSAKIFDFKADNVKIILKDFKKLSRIKLICYQQFGFLRALKREGINILYCPSVAAPIFYKKKIITIHDCAALRFKDEAGLFSRFYLKLIFLSAKYFSLKIVTVSDFAKQEIIDLLKIPAQKIAVISEGAPFLINIDDNILKTILAKFNLSDKKYFFYISNLRPRKNVSGLLKAWADFSSKHPEYYLVIAGRNNNYKSTDAKIIFPGIVSEEEKVALYKGAIALVFPSLYEGFGLPILEAQELGVPVISSNTSSLPEVAGTGALFFNPHDPKDICSSLEKFINYSFNKEDMINRGYKNLERFSWDKSSLLLLGIIDNFKKQL